MILKTSEVLRQAKALIVNEQNWLQGSFTTYVADEKCFCSLGAIANVLGVDNFKAAYSEPAILLKQQVLPFIIENYSPSGTFAIFNDNKTHGEVMEVFDKAIAVAEQTERL